MAKVFNETLQAGSLSKTINIDSGLTVSSILIINTEDHSQVLTDITINGTAVTVSLDSAYTSPLSIIVTGI